MTAKQPERAMDLPRVGRPRQFTDEQRRQRAAQQASRRRAAFRVASLTLGSELVQ